MGTKFRVKRGAKKDLPQKNLPGTFLYAEDSKELFITSKTDDLFLVNHQEDISGGYFLDPEDTNQIDGGEF